LTPGPSPSAVSGPKPDAIEVHLVAAARPNFMKIAPLYHALAHDASLRPTIVHTGQHYDFNMSEAFFRDLRLPDPAHHLEVGSGSHAEQTGRVMIEYEKVLLARRPDWIVVVGDVNSTVACALVGAKLRVPVVHLEAGLRSFDRRMPEEINRLATDAISDVLWTPSADADQNLAREGVDPARIDRVGNIMIDSLEMMRPAIEIDRTRQRLGLDGRRYAVVTLHRPSNVDDPATLAHLMDELCGVARSMAVVFVVHPRTRARLEQFGLLPALLARGAAWVDPQHGSNASASLLLCEPLGYVPFMSLLFGASVAITDSGGLQEETTYLGIPCLTMRENTERPITVLEGTNRLVSPADLGNALTELLEGRWPRGRRPDLWDGQTARRCVEQLKRRSGAVRRVGVP
jgi:UDP-N-acetylglucosamine 2-epimerase (non-hydrolysing)